MKDKPLAKTYRTLEVSQIVDTIQAGDSCTIVGVGSAGKSNLLRFLRREDILRERLGPQYLLVYVDGNKLIECSEWGLWELMLHQTTLAVEERGDATVEIVQALDQLYNQAIGAETRDFAVRYLDRTLNLVRKRLGLRLVFLLDEFDELYEQLPASGFSALRALRDDHKYQLSYLVATRQEWRRLRQEPEAAEAFEELVSPQTIWLGPYADSDARDMLERLAARHGKPLDGATQRLLLKETGGHPGLLSAAYRTAIENSRALDRSLRSSARIQDECRRIWYSLPADQQQAVGAMAVDLETNPPTGPVAAQLENKGLIAEVGPARYALFSRLFGDCIVQLGLHTGPQVRVDRNLHAVIVGNRRVDDLPALPFALIEYLDRHRGRACSRAELIGHLYPDEPQDDSASIDGRLDTVVARLRRAIEPDPSEPRYILTVRGHGYRLTDGQGER